MKIKERENKHCPINLKLNKKVPGIKPFYNQKAKLTLLKLKKISNAVFISDCYSTIFKSSKCTVNFTSLNILNYYFHNPNVFNSF